MGKSEKETTKYLRIFEHFGIIPGGNKEILVCEEPLKALFVLQFQDTKKKFKLVFHYDPEFPFAVTEKFTN